MQATRVLFSGAVLARRQHWTLLWSILLAAIPPLVFVLWVIWMKIALGERL